MNIGYIGLGLMGAPCARHLRNAGHTLHIWGRNKDKMRALLNEGMLWHDSPAVVAAHTQILFTNLTDTPDVQEVLLGKNGVLEGGKPGLIVVDMSTISAVTSRDMATLLKKSGIDFADAPVSGGTAGAQNATLTIMVGAEEEVFKKIEPVLSVLGSKITRIGDVGAGQVAKSCNQIVLTGALAAIAEAFTLAGRLGVDASRVRDALLGGFAGSKALEIHGLRMLEDNYAPGFKTSLHVKDMGIVSRLAQELGLALPVSALGLEYLRKAQQTGYGEEDSSSIFKVISKKTAV